MAESSVQSLKKSGHQQCQYSICMKWGTHNRQLLHMWEVCHLFMRQRGRMWKGEAVGERQAADLFPLNLTPTYCHLFLSSNCQIWGKEVDHCLLTPTSPVQIPHPALPCRGSNEAANSNQSHPKHLSSDFQPLCHGLVCRSAVGNWGGHVLVRPLSPLPPH